MPVRARSSVERFTIRWDAAMGCYRVSVPDLQGPVEVVSAALFDAQTQNYIEENNARAAAEAEVERLRKAAEGVAAVWKGRRVKEVDLAPTLDQLVAALNAS